MGGGDVGAAFSAALARTGTTMTSKDLTEQYPSCPPRSSDSKPIVLEQCKFFDLFDADPEEAREEMRRKRQEIRETHGESYLRSIMESNRHHPLRKNRRYDFRLTPEEKEKLAATGVVALQRMEADSFGEVYYRLYSDDLPVFVTADSILHAWHRSFDAFLIRLETTYLSPTLDDILISSLTKCQTMLSDGSEDNSTVLQAVEDVVEYLTIGLSLLRGELEEEDPQLEALWRLIHAEKASAMEILGARRLVDFSLFKPRGHYTKSEKLKCYFRAMMWLGSIDFRIPGGACQRDDLHQLLCAVIVVHCLHDSDNLDAVENANYVISSLVADGGLGADSLSVSELAKLVVPTNVAKLIIETATREEERSKLLQSLQQQIAQKGLGAQLIPGSLVEGTALGAIALAARPASFALLGQRFVWSAFIFTRLVYDQVVQEETKQSRRIPSAVDVAFTLFGNNEAAQVLARRMEATADDDDAEFVRRRDGIPFASNLIALRQVLDEEFNDSDEETKSSSGANDDEPETVEPQRPAAISTTKSPKGIAMNYSSSSEEHPENDNESISDYDSDSDSSSTESASISTLWLRALRALSRPSPNTASTFHSGTWQRRQMNTQIASFTQLRHGTVLYAKQGSMLKPSCEYPDGMVDPYPVFWQRMGELALRAKGIADITHMHSARTLFEDFASTMETLERISVCQATHKQLNDGYLEFMNSVMEEKRGS